MQLYTETFGSGPAIIFCHGFGGSARNFRLQARVLSAHFRVTLFDWPGHARSPAPEGAEAYGVPALLEDLNQLVLAEKPPLILVGLSMGAKIALDYALQQPARVRALVLASYPMAGDVEKRRHWALGFADAIEQRGLDEAGAEFVWGERSRFDPKGASLIRQGLLEHAPRALAHIQRQLLARSVSPNNMAEPLRQLTTPTCLIAGTDDPESLEPTRELAQLLPHSELHELEGAGHVVNLTKPTLFNQILVDFLAPFRAAA